MTQIKVLDTATGCWSAPILGIDKDFLVKELILSRFLQGEYLSTDRKRRFPVMKDPDCVVEHIELDMVPVRYADILHKVRDEVFTDPDTGDEVVIERTVRDDEDGRYLLTWTNLNTDIHSLLVGLGNLVDFTDYLKAEKMAYLVPAIEEIVAAANLPVEAAAEHPVIIKFD